MSAHAQPPGALEYRPIARAKSDDGTVTLRARGEMPGCMMPVYEVAWWPRHGEATREVYEWSPAGRRKAEAGYRAMCARHGVTP